MVIVGDDFDLSTVDAALGVDFVGRELRGLGDRRTRDRLGLGDDPNLDRALLLRLGERTNCDCEDCRTHTPHGTQDNSA